MAFGRLAQLTVGPAGGKGQLVQNLYMTFTVRKSIQTQVPTAEIRIYNMKEASYSSFVRKRNSIILQAGYADEINGGAVPFLFSGTIIYSRRYKEKADWIVQVFANGGGWSIGNAIVTMSYAGPIIISTLLQNLIPALQNEVAIINLKNVTPFSFGSGFSFGPGTVYDLLRLLCDPIQFNFSIEGSTITLFPPLRKASSAGLASTEISAPIGAISGYSLSQSTGLLLPPEPLRDMLAAPYDGAVSSDAEDQAFPMTRWKITCLLLPLIGPGTIFEVVSPAFATRKTLVKAMDLTYTGDTRAGDWKLESECITVDSTGAQINVEPA